MHAIVPGGAGFIGSNVAAAFVRDGHRVTMLDTLLRTGSERNLAWLSVMPGTPELRLVPLGASALAGAIGCLFLLNTHRAK